MNKLRVASFFAGVGGIDKGFEKQSTLRQCMLMRLIFIQ